MIIISRYNGEVAILKLIEASSLDHGDSLCSILGQTSCYSKASGTTANDDIWVLLAV